MARNAKEKLLIDQRRLRVSELSLKGWSQVAIAQEMGISQATVSTDLAAIQKEWRESRIQNREEAIDRELAEGMGAESRIRDRMRDVAALLRMVELDPTKEALP